jgi:predicted AAA+ superfamily ATPase
VVAAGSLLGVKLTEPLSFPVGKVTMRHLYPLTFAEFLDAMGEHPLRAMMDGLDKVEPVPGPLHERLVALLKTYYVVGGMPEAVRMYAETGSYDRAREVHADILGAYERDFAKHVPTVDIPKVSLIWDSEPAQLARENRKFIFSALSGSARAREYEAALRWLRDAGLVHLAHAVTTVQQPLAGFANRAAFKVYALDTGLLAAKVRLPAATVLDGNALFTTYHGMLVENYVAQHLMSMPGQGTSLYYWQSESYGAEVDFLVDMPPDVFPLEVKAGINPRSKSLKSYDGRFHPPRLLRTTLLNFAAQERITNIPLYAISLLPKLVSAL